MYQFLNTRDAEVLKYFLFNRFSNFIFFSPSFLSLQYYEMSYGLNVEMHKQVRICAGIKMESTQKWSVTSFSHAVVNILCKVVPWEPHTSLQNGVWRQTWLPCDSYRVYMAVTGSYIIHGTYWRVDTCTQLQPYTCRSCNFYVYPITATT